MSSSDGRPATQTSRRRWAGWFTRRGREKARETAPEPQDEDAVDIVDQAEAFQTLRVRDVMTPRADIVALEISTPLDEALRRFVESELTRMPVYRETLDDPVGLVHIKDIVRLLAPGPDGEPQTVNWKQPVLHRLRREALYVPTSMRCADLLVKMRVAHLHLALVIDEFGGVDGLVTMEDLVEAVVGEIGDEHDEDEAPKLVVRPGGVIEADARVPLEDLEQALGHDLQPEDEDEEIDTVAGLVATLAGRVPQRGEVIVHPSGYEFEVTEADPRRIRRLRIRRTETEAAPTPEAGESA
jgi:CBS domain containing-hemolysin-like protein